MTTDGINQVAAVLQRTLSPDNQIRKHAEAELKSYEKVAGLGAILLRLASSTIPSGEIVPDDIRMSAAIALKNFVRDNWSGDGEAPLEEVERNQLREETLSLMFEIPVTYQKQFSNAVCLMAKYDFPVKWPKLVQVLAQYLASEELPKLFATLTTMDDLFQRYRHELKSDKLWREIKFVLDNSAAPITNLYTRMVELIGQANSMSYDQCTVWLNVLWLLAKIYHSLISQELPEFFEDNLKPWMEGFISLLKLDIPTLESKADDNEANPLDRIKVEVCEIVTLYSQRFEEEILPYMDRFIDCIWQVLVTCDHRIRFDVLVYASLDFLSAICLRPVYRNRFEVEGVLQEMCEKVIMKNLLLRDEDVELFEDEPFEYLKRDIEGSDRETRRRGAADFVRSLCKNFESQVVQILGGTIQHFLSDYAQNPTENWRQKDVIYCLVTAMASKGETASYGATTTSQIVDVNDFYQNCVRQDLFQPDLNFLPILRSDALKFVVVFRNQLNPDFLAEIFNNVSIIRLFQSQHTILPHYLAYAVDRLLLVKKLGTNVYWLTGENIPIGTMIDEIFSCFKNGHSYLSHYLVKALMRCFNVMNQETSKRANIFVGYLETMIRESIKTARIPLFTHFMFESLCVLVKKAYTSVDGGLDKYTIPIIEMIIPNDVIDYIPYALQITALLLDQNEAERLKGKVLTSEQFLPFFPYLLKNELWANASNTPALILVLESYIRSFTPIVVGEQYAQQVIGCFQRLIMSKALDQHGFKLANALLPHLDTNERMSSRMVLLPMLNRLQTNKTYKFVKQLVFFLCRYAIVRGAAALVDTLENIQPAMYLMIVERILIAELRGMPQTTTYNEKRVVTIGVAKLCCETNLGPHFAELVTVTVLLLEALYSGPKNVVDEDEEEESQINELEYTDPYCKLSNAQHVDSIGQDVPNVKKYLAEAVLVRAMAVYTDAVRNLNPELLKKLEYYMTTP